MKMKVIKLFLLYILLCFEYMYDKFYFYKYFFFMGIEIIMEKLGLFKRKKEVISGMIKGILGGNFRKFDVSF